MMIAFNLFPNSIIKWHISDDAASRDGFVNINELIQFLCERREHHTFWKENMPPWMSIN